MVKKHSINGIIRVLSTTLLLTSVPVGGLENTLLVQTALATTTHQTVITPDKTAPLPPRVNVVKDTDTVLTGTAEVNALITVMSGSMSLGTVSVGSDGAFSVSIPAQAGGTVLLVTATDAAGNTSHPTKVVVKDTTAPLAPTVNKVLDKDKTITGLSEPGATITVKSGTRSIGNAKVAKDGSFTVHISPQLGGTVLLVTATDSSRNMSPATSMTVVDTTAPKSPKVNPIKDTDTQITGIAEKNSTVKVSVGDLVLGTQTVSTDGKFNLEIPAQTGGTKIDVTATDASNNESIATVITVKDTTPPLAPQVNQVLDKDSVVTGTAEPNSKITVKAGTRIVGTGSADAQGDFSVSTKPQTGGVVLTFTATDSSRNVSPPTTISVVDTTAPNAPKVNPVKDSDVTITGSAEVGSIITVSINSTTTLGTGTVGKNGKFSITIDTQQSGTILEITATDAAGNMSSPTTVTVAEGPLTITSLQLDPTSSLLLTKNGSSAFTSSENSMYQANEVGTLTFSFNREIQKSSPADIGIFLNNSRVQVPDSVKNLLLSKIQNGGTHDLTLHIPLTYSELKNALNLINGKPVSKLLFVVKDLDGKSLSVTLTIK